MACLKYQVLFPSWFAFTIDVIEGRMLVTSYLLIAIKHNFQYLLEWYITALMFSILALELQKHSD